MAEPPSIRAFLKAFGVRWFTQMSGPISVPLTAVSFFVPQTGLKVLFGVSGILCMVISSYGVWAEERRKRNEAESLLDTDANDEKILAYMKATKRHNSFYTVSEIAEGIHMSQRTVVDCLRSLESQEKVTNTKADQAPGGFLWRVHEFEQSL